jgi:hypothetical protein
MNIFPDRVIEFKKKLNRVFCSILFISGLVVTTSGNVLAGGGMVLEGDKCIIWIDFYSAHFTAYQPDNRGNEQFCQQLPDVAETIFVLDYLHPSLKDVGVGFRIIRDVTGQGSFVKLKHVEEIEDIEQHTVFYQQPVIQQDASLKIVHHFKSEGSYIGIVTAGHPGNDTIYTAVFPFEVGGSNYVFIFPVILFIGVVAFFWLRRISVARKAGLEKGSGL